MKLSELANLVGLEALTGDIGLNRDIVHGYVSDLLSDVIANIDEHAIWITIQRHINILGVAKLKDVGAIVVPRGLEVEQEVIDKAKQEEVPILRSELSSFEIAGRIYNALQKG